MIDWLFYCRLFRSHGVEAGDVNLVDSVDGKYEIQGHYNLIVKSTQFSDAGVYLCQITEHGNYTADVSVLGEFPVVYFIHFIRMWSATVIYCILGCYLTDYSHLKGMSDKRQNRPILSADKIARQISVVCHAKIARFLSADKIARFCPPR